MATSSSSGMGGGFGVSLLVTTIGGMMIFSALKGLSFTDVLAGKKGNKLDPKGGGIPDLGGGGNFDFGADPQSSGGGGKKVSPRLHGPIVGTPYNGTHTLGNWQSDNAIDITYSIGTPLPAVDDAVVTRVSGSWNGGVSRFDGFQVTMKLADGNSVFYTHLSKEYVHVGQRLKAGEIIGLSGAASRTPHLHFAAQHGDPRKYYG